MKKSSTYDKLYLNLQRHFRTFVSPHTIQCDFHQNCYKNSNKTILLEVIQFHCQMQELNMHRNELLPQKGEPEEEFTEQQSLAN